MNSQSLSEFLKRIELFKELNDKELNYISSLVEIVKYESDTLLFEENTPRTSVYIIYEGDIELFKKTPLGAENRVAFFSKYDFLSEGSLMDNYPHSTSAKALTGTTALVIDAEHFKSFMKEHPATAGKVLSQIAKVISRRMRHSTTRVVNAGTQYLSGRTRQEHDLLGYRDVPDEYYYGIQTLRAIENFNISGIAMAHFPVLVKALAMVKIAAAKANAELEILPLPIANAIVQACNEIINGKYHSHFSVDMIQGGAGTSANMNANEVIANRALEILGYEKGEYKYCHPNNHVNLSQSTNDAYPTALKIATINSNKKLIRILKELIAAFKEKADEFSNMIKMGRTQLQDAVPMTLGQEFQSYSATLEEEVERLDQNSDLFLEVNMGGTAIGTGINADPRYSDKVIHYLREISGLEIKLASNLVEATQDTGAFIMYSSALKRLSVKLSKISNDLRLLSSGPRAGFNEINLPKMQPGSSIMPGKVNPVIPEVVNQIAFKVIGNDLTVTMAAEAGQLELNVMEPIIAQSIFESIEMLKNGMVTLTHRCIKGITANEKRMREIVKNSIGIVTALNPVLGYETCTDLATEALENDRGVYELVLEKKLLTKKELDDLLAPEKMIHSRFGYSKD